MKRFARALVSIGRRWWHQLTSMRTALILLLLLALAAIPGSLFPQRDINPETVGTYFAENPDLAPILDRLWLFDVYTSPWFSAIYLLLMISLIGCIIPRAYVHFKAMRTPPPAAPKRLDLMPYHRSIGDSHNPETDASTINSWLKKRFYRSRILKGDDGSVTVSAEKGILRETGNLFFHISLIIILFGAAIGSVYGWYGNRLLVEGEEHAFCNNLQQYHEYGLGPWVDESDLAPFCLRLDEFTADFSDAGQATNYEADLSYTEDAGDIDQEYNLRVNHPLQLDGAYVFLLGHGFAPVINYTDRYGVTQTSVMPFLPVDNALNSEGVALFPDANYDMESGEIDPDAQVGFEGLFIPDYDMTTPMILSDRPMPENPAMMMWAYRGDLGFDDGMPRSVYEIDRTQVEADVLDGIPYEDTAGIREPGSDDPNPEPFFDDMPDAAFLMEGETWELDDGSYVEFAGYERFAVLEIRHEPGHWTLLIGSIMLLVALFPMLYIRRRRFWVRFNADQTIEIAGLNRTESDRFSEECDTFVRDVAHRIDLPDPTGVGTESSVDDEPDSSNTASDSSGPDSDSEDTNRSTT